MTKLKRITAGLMLCLFLFSLTACGEQPQPEIESGEATDNGTVRYTKTITVERLYEKEDLESDEVVSALTKTGIFKIEDLEYKLCDVKWERMDITGRSIDLASSIDYGFTTAEPKPPEVKVVEYQDPRSGETVTARLPLVHFGLKNSRDLKDFLILDAETAQNAIVKSDDSYGWEWRNDLKIPLKATLTGEYLKFGKLYIPYKAEAPVYATYEEAVLRSLDLNTEKYRITGSYWSGDVKVEDGEEVRYGYFTGERYCADFMAYYSLTQKLPDVKGWRAVLTYEAFAAKDAQGPAIIAGGSVLALAIPVVTWLLIIRKKKKDKENETNEKA